MTKKKLPEKHYGMTRAVRVGSDKLFLRTGEFEDGSLGEIFIDMYKQGSSFRAIMDCVAILTSKLLQYGCPLEELVDTFTFSRFEPAGMVVGHESIKNCTSVMDFIFRSLAFDYLGRTDFVHIKPEVHECKCNGECENNDKTIEENEPVIIKKEIYDKIAEETNDGSMHSSPPELKLTPGMAKNMGYTGESCSTCGSMKVKKNGTCSVCLDCGTTSGCS